MPNLTATDLRDPAPPMPGRVERTAVARRAHELGRRRRVMQGMGALGLVAAVAVSVAALTANNSTPGRTARIDAAGAAGATGSTVAGPGAEPAATFTVSGAISNIPAGVTVTVTLSGAGGTFDGVADANGNLALSGIPAGTYSVKYEWVSPDNTATRVGKLDPVTVTGDATLNLALP